MTKTVDADIIAGKTVLVTGAASGIGWSTAKRFAVDGATVVLADIDRDRVTSRANELPGRHHAIAVDLSDAAAALAMVNDCIEKTGALDILVNCAGITTNNGLMIHEQSPADLRRILDVNLSGSLAAAEQACRHMAQNGGGSVVNIASGAAFRALPYRSSYSASKAAILTITKKLAERYSSLGVRVNVVSPGMVLTELLQDLIAKGKFDPDKAAVRVPLGRIGQPEDIAEAIRFIADPKLSGVAGAVLNVDGGSHIYGGGGYPTPARQRIAGPKRDTRIIVGIDLEPELAAALLGKAAINGDSVLLTDGGLQSAGDAELRSMLSGIAGKYGRIDGIVCGDNGASGLDERLGRFHEAVRAAGDILIAQGHGCFIAAVGGAGKAEDESIADAGARSALEMLARSLACEWGRLGVRVNAIRNRTPASAISQQDAARTVEYLVSDRAGYVNGAILDIGGF